ncbi:hypothetical protein ATK30_4298 [Amycolatopsis echigonensis]|uniref:Uncharacterized protein n=1 Tax=Amycolatopsis echigonensis TaxID=2576905 RepID=A0A2N3WHU5_9PSEU|nr:hypothetical protein [Amycolatopsis niigatensis]PKV93450.1 hypothetical protein ATK30_4298 [Amycolatopsis niigatensis]
MEIAILFLLAVLILLVVLAVFPWRRRAEPWALSAVVLFSLGWPAYEYWDRGMPSTWAPQVWLIVLGPGFLIAIVRLFRIALKG